jgi:threonine dehydrogenase-like Zn-dependent dehydrogenase
MQMVIDRGLKPEQVITHRLPLADAAAGYQLFDSRQATKVVVVP